MLIKRGKIVSHHFAHQSKKICDPWYTGKMSHWHKRMQHIFPQKCQEQVIWNDTHTEFHIADVAFSYQGTPYVIEFQHSPISREDFLSRSSFYLSLGYMLVWIFDFCECKNPKRIFYTHKDPFSRKMELIWPGNDRIRFLDFFKLHGLQDCLHIFFYINTGEGMHILHEREDFPSWYTWEYINPFSLERYFVKIDYSESTSLNHFFATYYQEQEFINFFQGETE